MHRLAIALLGALGAALLPAGCGSSGPSCPATFTPCGGDIVGTWTYEAACGANPQLSMACPTATSNLGTSTTGTIAFTAGGTFTETVTVHDSGTVTFPVACLTGITSCAQLDASNNASGLSIVSSGCAGTVTESCTCTIVESGTATLTGTYTTAGNDVTLTVAGNPAGTPSPYCATASQLDLAEGSSTGSYALFSK
jgi:hypothetical protein